MILQFVGARTFHIKGLDPLRGFGVARCGTPPPNRGLRPVEYYVFNLLPDPIPKAYRYCPQCYPEKTS